MPQLTCPSTHSTRSNPVLLIVLAAQLCLSGCQNIATKSGATEQSSSARNGADNASVITANGNEAKLEPAGDVQAAIMAAEFAWQDGRVESAAKHYARAAMASDDPEIIAHAMQVIFSAKQWALAEPLLDHVAKNPKIPQTTIWQGRAAIALAKKDEDGAFTALSQLLQTKSADGSKTRAQKMLAPALATADDKALAVRLFEQLLAKDAFGTDVKDRIFTSKLAEQLNLPEQAARLADDAVVTNPTSAEAIRWRGELRYRAEKFEQALNDFASAVKLEPQNAELILFYAASLDDRKQTEKAIDVLKNGPQTDATLTSRAAYAARAGDKAAQREVYLAIKSQPEPIPETRRELLGQLAELIDDKTAALAWYQGIGKGERYVDAQLRVAILHDALGDTKTAMKTLEALRAQGLDDNEQLRDSFLVQYEIHKRHKDVKAGLDVLNDGLSVLVDDRDLLYARAIDQVDRNELKMGLDDLRRLVQLHPDDADLLNALGYTLTDRTDQHDEAKQWIDKALALKPNDGAILDSLGWVKFHLGDFAGALKALNEAWAKQTDADIAIHLAETHLKLGDRAAAKAALDAGAEKNPAHEGLIKARQRLGL